MKKVLFTVLAAFVMTVAFTSCKDSKSTNGKDATEQTDMDDEDDDDDDDDVVELKKAGSQGEQAVAAIGEMVDIMKETHIASEADALELKNKLENLEAKYGNEVLEGVDMENLPDDLKEKAQELSGALVVEMMRIGSEAEEAGIDLDNVFE